LKKEYPYSERHLLESIARGDTQAYRQLFDAYWDRVYGVALHLTKSPEQARDLAQDIFLKLWDARSGLAGVRNFDNFLYVVTRNLFHDHIRNRVFRESNKEFLTQFFSGEESSPHQRLEQKEMSQALEQAINGLPPQLRQVFVLHRLEGLSHEEIARRLHISPLSSKTYMTRALIALRRHLGDL